MDEEELNKLLTEDTDNDDYYGRTETEPEMTHGDAYSEARYEQACEDLEVMHNKLFC